MDDFSRKRNRYFIITLILILIQIRLGLNAAAQSKSNEIDEDVTGHAKDILTGNTPEAKLFVLRKYFFIENAMSTLTSISRDTSLEFRMRSNQGLSLFLTSEELHEITPQGIDPIGQDLLRKNRDVAPVILISPLLSQGIKSLIKKLNPPNKKLLGSDFPIPKDIEIDILKILWTYSAATPSDIYAQMDSSWPVTSEDLHKILGEMVERGFVARKKISPSNEFNIFGIARIEMSSKNRKNKDYVYWPLIPKEKLITYLEARRFLVLTYSERRSTNGEKSNLQKTLEQKLYRLIQ
ncbi:MAG: hypothetical protein ACE5JB_09140 [bacterium]